MFTGKFADKRVSPIGKNSSLPLTTYSDQQLSLYAWGSVYTPKSKEMNDAEFLAQQYQQHGISAFIRIDGSFTCVICTADELVIVRDHHGTSHQVYFNNTSFASSLLQLQSLPGFSNQVNETALCSFLAVGYIPTGTSAFNGVSKLAAGSALICKGNEKQIINLFETNTILPASSDGSSLDALAEEYGKLHRDAIRQRIGNSNNVGMLLSGGYDSGSNLAALRSLYDGTIRTFSIGFKGDNWSELPLAECMANHFETAHHQYEIDGSEINGLPDIVRSVGDPFVEGGLMVNYAAMRLIGNNKPDVILGGDGSDQYFGTSGREVALHYLASRSGAKPMLNLLHTLLGQSALESNSFAYRTRFHLSKVLHIMNGDMFGFEPFNLRKMVMSTPYGEKNSTFKTDCRSFEHLYTQHAYKSDIEKIINQVILFKATRMAQLFDNRIAFPFMDLNLYNFLQKVPVAYKCNGESALKIAKGRSTAKFLLKYHYKPLLPKEITERKKQGGFAPMPIFFQDNNQRRRIADFILNSSVIHDFLNRKAIESFIKSYDLEVRQPANCWFWYRQNRAIQYFYLLNLAVWWETYVSGNRSLTL